jgi:hypothetical protein
VARRIVTDPAQTGVPPAKTSARLTSPVCSPIRRVLSACSAFEVREVHVEVDVCLRGLQAFSLVGLA